MDYLQKIIEHIELHSVAGIRECFENGLSPNEIWNGEPLIYELTSEYTRTPRFKNCVQAFVDYGLVFDDPFLLAVLLNNAETLSELLQKTPEALKKKYTLRCAYTPFYQVGLMHICTEFNMVDCAKVLVKYGADINEKAGVDEQGLGGQTPVFHAVNQNGNQSYEMLLYLLLQQADLQFTVKGFIWGKGYTWETLIPAVNPISYAMMGLLPQFHRNPKTIAEIVALLWKTAYEEEVVVPNIPNAYLG